MNKWNKWIKLGGAALVITGVSYAGAVIAVSDTDADGVVDSLDNCISVSNGNGIAEIGACGFQEDDDGDGYGNACDADLDNDQEQGLAADVVALANSLYQFSPANGADLDCDGQVLASDVALMTKRLGAGAPGPSGLVP